MVIVLPLLASCHGSPLRPQATKDYCYLRLTWGGPTMVGSLTLTIGSQLRNVYANPFF